tara:strand:- start:2270 stop:2659 length:390 start_codon:yes stop_codon:yes gene_type:complete
MDNNFDQYFILNDDFCYKNVDLVRIIDGDTIVCNIHLGFGLVKLNQIIHLYAIDTPELRGKEKIEGKIAKNALIDFLKNRNIKIYTIEHKKSDLFDKYGRLLGIIVDKDTNENINLKLLIENYAVLKIF